MQPWILENVTVTDKLLLTSQEQWGSRVPLLQDAIWSLLLQILHRVSSRPLSAWPGQCPFHRPFIRSHSCDKREKVKFSTTNKPTGQSPSSPAWFLLPPLVCLPNETNISIYLSFFFFCAQASRDARRYLFPLRKQEVNGNYLQGNVKHSGCYFSASMCVMKLKLSLWNPQRHIRLEGEKGAAGVCLCFSPRIKNSAGWITRKIHPEYERN